MNFNISKYRGFIIVQTKHDISFKYEIKHVFEHNKHYFNKIAITVLSVLEFTRCKNSQASFFCYET